MQPRCKTQDPRTWITVWLTGYDSMKSYCDLHVSWIHNLIQSAQHCIMYDMYTVLSWMLMTIKANCLQLPIVKLFTKSYWNNRLFEFRLETVDFFRTRTVSTGWFQNPVAPRASGFHLQKMTQTTNQIFPVAWYSITCALRISWKNTPCWQTDGLGDTDFLSVPFAEQKRVQLFQPKFKL